MGKIIKSLKKLFNKKNETNVEISSIYKCTDNYGCKDLQLNHNYFGFIGNDSLFLNIIDDSGFANAYSKYRFKQC